MGRLEELMQQKGGESKPAAGAFAPKDLDRLDAAWRPSGAKTRAEFIAIASMDAVEKVEAAMGGKEKLAAQEQERQKKAADAKKAAEAKKAVAVKK